VAGLTDMEELLGRVSQPDIKSYLREAFVCYGAGAYRACIVLTANALFEDLRQKTRAVASANSDAKEISEAIEKLAADQKVFETTLVERLASKGILSKALADRLKQIIAHRNKAAHPSGVHASAEEARWVFFEAIDKFLSEPVLSANQMVDHLMSKLTDENYFPDTSIHNITNIAREEVDQLHPLAYPYLVTKTVELLASADATVNKNARFFLSGCARIKNEDLRASLSARFVKVKASDKTLRDPLMSVMSNDPGLYAIADGNTKLRLATLFTSAVPDKVATTSMRHPLTLLGNFAAELDEAVILPGLKAFVDAVIATFYATPGIGKLLKTDGIIREMTLKAILDHAGSNDFDIANRFAKAAPGLDEGLAAKLRDREAFQVIAAIAKAAEDGAYSARNVRRQKFETVPELKAKAELYLAAKPKGATTILTDLGLETTGKAFTTDHLTVEDDDF